MSGNFLLVQTFIGDSNTCKRNKDMAQEKQKPYKTFQHTNIPNRLHSAAKI
jgi:hypothetical protein